MTHNSHPSKERNPQYGRDDTKSETSPLSSAVHPNRILARAKFRTHAVENHRRYSNANGRTQLLTKPILIINMKGGGILE